MKMIDNPIIETGLLILFGVCIGVLIHQWYTFRLIKNVVLKCVSIVGVKVKGKDVTAEQLWSILSSIVEKTFDEVKDDQFKESFKTKIESTVNK